ncbi:hypothetical protein M513_07309 [Trichuris suis]|uniref:Uncharacterized protein n=1 Tax=Trichuris suis TaxID=68888 RepID=A0A085M3I6_9BILA|nr:hypothetical protein M513_07309 [Trichuris suis]
MRLRNEDEVSMVPSTDLFDGIYVTRSLLSLCFVDAVELKWVVSSLHLQNAFMVDFQFTAYEDTEAPYKSPHLAKDYLIFAIG